MARRAGTKTSRADGGAAIMAAPSQVDQPVACTTSAALVALAEELGRLLARRELSQLRNRRGYGLPELLLGASVMAVVSILIARTPGWLVP